MGQGPPSAGSVGILREAVVYHAEVLGHNVVMVKKKMKLMQVVLMLMQHNVTMVSGFL